LSLWTYRTDGVGDAFCPAYFDAMPFAQLQENAFQHMSTLAKRYQGRIDLWEINEPNTAWTNPLNLTWDQKVEYYRSAIAGAHNGSANAKIMVDSPALPYEFNTAKLERTDTPAAGLALPEFLDLMASRDVDINTIGLEFYYAGVGNGGGYGPPGLSLATVSRLLDRYSAYDKPIFIRELMAPSVQHPGSSWWHRPWDEATQAEFVEKFYTIAFSKPLVKEIAWSYGVSDETTAIQDGGLLHSDLSPKPAYYALRDRIAAWTTSGAGVTDNKGEYLLRGFGGEYRVTVTLPGGIVKEVTVEVVENVTQENEPFSHAIYFPSVIRQ
jgi:hypothetical protein